MKKFFAFATAVAVAASSLVVAAPASAQNRVVVRERTVVRQGFNERRRGNGYAYGQRRNTRRVCTVRIRRGERIRTCRVVRY